LASAIVLRAVRLLRGKTRASSLRRAVRHHLAAAARELSAHLARAPPLPKQVVAGNPAAQRQLVYVRVPTDTPGFGTLFPEVQRPSQ